MERAMTPSSSISNTDGTGTPFRVRATLESRLEVRSACAGIRNGHSLVKGW